MLSVGAAIAQQQAPSATGSELEKAVEEFQIQTKRLGMVEGAVPVRRGGDRKQSRWHGRLFENLRNDFLDAVPHEVAQRGGEKNLLRRNQFGFNVSGPVLLPRLYEGGITTFFTFTFLYSPQVWQTR